MNLLRAQRLARFQTTRVSRGLLKSTPSSIFSPPTSVSRVIPCLCQARNYAAKPHQSKSDKYDKVVAEIAKQAEDQARKGEGFDYTVNPTELLESLPDSPEIEFTLDPKRLKEIRDHATRNWRRFRNLPAGWQSKWDIWELLFTFYYPTPHYFLLVPQIDMVLNVRYAIPGEARPLMYNNELEAFFFNMVERGTREDEWEKESSRQIYFMDWKGEELYLVEDAATVKDVAQQMITGGGLQGLKLQKLEADAEGEKVLERVLEHDESVLPVLVDKYLGYTPAPSDELQDKLLEQSEEEIGDRLVNLVEQPGDEVQKEGSAAHEEIMQMMMEDVEDPSERENIQEMLDSLKHFAPEEIRPLRDLLKLLKHTDPSQYPDLQDVFRRQLMSLEREVQEDGRVLSELLIQSRRKAAP